MRNALYLHMLILKTFPEFQIGCAKKDNAITQNKRTRTKTHNTRHRNVLTDREKAQTIASNAPQPKQVTREEEQQLTEDKKPTKNRIEELTESNSCSSNKHQQQQKDSDGRREKAFAVGSVTTVDGRSSQGGLVTSNGSHQSVRRRLPNASHC